MSTVDPAVDRRAVTEPVEATTIGSGALPGDATVEAAMEDANRSGGR